MSIPAKLLQRDPVAVAREEEKGLVAWAKRRTWTRTESTRWLNERSEAVLAWLRRKPGRWPERSRQVGEWLKVYSPKIFDRAHARLGTAKDDDARAALLPGEVLR